MKHPLKDTPLWSDNVLKRVGYLYEQLCDIDLIYSAIDNAAEHKKKKSEVIRVLIDRDHYANKILTMFQARDVKFANLKTFTNYDPHSKKTRTIHRPDFYPDQIIHWCIILVIKPLLMRGMYQYCCGSVPGRGLYYGVKHVRKWINCDKVGTQYVAKLDISKFYDSVDLSILTSKFYKIIKDEEMLSLIKQLLAQSPDGIGIPIGNYTSQWFANFYLQELDHYIKEQLGIKHYMRYIDDMILFAPTSTELHTAVRKIERFLNEELNLQLKGNWHIQPIADGLDFLGYVFFPNYTKIRGRNFLSFARQARELSYRIDNGLSISSHDAMGMLCRYVLIQRSKFSYNIIHKYLPEHYVEECKKIVSKATKKQNQAIIQQMEVSSHEIRST